MLRLSNQMLARNTLSQLQDVSSDLYKTQRKMSSGKEITARPTIRSARPAPSRAAAISRRSSSSRRTSTTRCRGRA